MVQEVVGSIPISHPNFFNNLKVNWVDSAALFCAWGDNRGDKMAPYRPQMPQDARDARQRWVFWTTGKAAAGAQRAVAGFSNLVGRSSGSEPAPSCNVPS